MEFISDSTGIDEKAVKTIIKKLESLRIVERLPLSTDIQLCFRYSKEILANLYNDIASYYLGVFDALIRSQNTIDVDKYINIDIDSICTKYQLHINDFIEGLSYLNNRSIISFDKPSLSSSIRIIAQKQNFDELGIDFDKQEKQKEFTLNKLNDVVVYARTSDCKRNFILDYFADKTCSGKCGVCSSCLGISMDNRVFSVVDKSTFNEHHKIIIQTVYELNGRFGRTTIADILKGKGREKIERNGLTDN